MKDRYILAFETSCDETSVAVLKNETELLSNVIASQIESHKRFGGVVPSQRWPLPTVLVWLGRFWSAWQRPSLLLGLMIFPCFQSIIWLDT